MSEPYTPGMITSLLRTMPAERLREVRPIDFHRWPVRKIVPSTHPRTHRQRGFETKEVGMMKERPLTDRQREALLAAEDTLYGDTKMVSGCGRCMRGLHLRGLVDGDLPHVYLTDAGKAKLRELTA